MFTRSQLCLLGVFLFCVSRIWAIDGVILVTTDPAYTDKWNYTKGGSTPQFSKSDTVFRDQPFSILLFLVNYATDHETEAAISFDVELIDPSFQTVYQQSNLPALKAKVQDPMQVMLGDASVWVSLNSEHLLGRYVIKIRLHDWKDNSYQELEQELILEEFVYSPIFEKEEQFLTWQHTYYQHPKPTTAVDAFLYFANSTLCQDETVYWPSMVFFREIYKANPFLIPHLIAKYDQQIGGARKHILYLLRFTEYRDSQFFTSLSSAEMAFYRSIINRDLAQPKVPITSPRELEMLWYMFLATGSFDPINRIASSLDYSSYGRGSYRGAEDPVIREMPTALRDGIYENTVLQLVTTCDEHPLVRDYCKFLLNYTEQSEAVKFELKEILDR